MLIENENDEFIVHPTKLKFGREIRVLCLESLTESGMFILNHTICELRRL